VLAPLCAGELHPSAYAKQGSEMTGDGASALNFTTTCEVNAFQGNAIIGFSLDNLQHVSALQNVQLSVRLSLAFSANWI
jgi:hypothetical protein